MKNRVVAALISVLITSVLFANGNPSGVNTDVISVNTAYENAIQFLNAQRAAGRQTMRKSPLRQSDLTLCAQRPDMYIFNVGSSEGFLVASASNLSRPVLCYSTDGQWDENNMSQALGWLFEQYDAEIAAARKSRAKAPEAPVNIVKTPIEPLIKTEWHQHSPYNVKLTPFTWGGEKYNVPTGCVATAMAQIMNYHQWPKTIRQTIPGYNHGQLVGDEGNEVVVSDVPAGTVIDWEHANVKSLWMDSDPAAIDAVSNLMQYCGTAVRMYYSESTSSSHNLSAMYALKYYFDYDPAIYIAERSKYTYYDWCNLLYNELRAGRPILYNGQSNYGGHSFIIDGYDGNEMFHFNLGWNQKTSVYAILSSVGHDSSMGNPDAYDSPDGYVYHQTAVLNVQKAALSQGVYHVSLTTDSYYLSGEESVIVTYFNNEDEGYTFDLGLGYRDADGNIQVVKSFEGVKIAKTGSKNQSYTGSDLTLSPGIYRLLPVARLSGGQSEWEFVSNEFDYYIATAAADGKVTLADHSRNVDLSLASLTFSGNPYAGHELYVFCTLKNSGEEDFFDKLYFFWNDNPANKGIEAGHYLLWSHATVNAGGTAPVEFYFTPDREGDYTVWITTDQAGENVVGQANVSIGAQLPYEVSDQVPFAITNVTLANSRDFSLLGNDIVVSFDATNTSPDVSFYGFVHMGVFLYKGTYKFGEMNPNYIYFYDIIPGQTRHFQLNVSDIDPGADNIQFVTYMGNWTPAYTSPVYHIEPSVFTYTPDGVEIPLQATPTFAVPESAGAVDLTMVSNKVIRVVPNSNPNTIYYIKAGSAMPAGLQGRNVVHGDKADKITLDGSYGVAVPLPFAAQSAALTKQLPKDKWRTLCLPFDYVPDPALVDLATVTDEDADHLRINPINKIAAYQPSFIRSHVEGAVTLTASSVQFPKQTNAIATINNFKAQGVLGKATVRDAYVLNDQGTALSLQPSAQVEPFTAFFVPSKRGYAPTSAVAIDYDATQAEVVGLQSVPTPAPASAAPRYNLSGQRVSRDYRGIVVEQGRKLLVK